MVSKNTIHEYARDSDLANMYSENFIPCPRVLKNLLDCGFIFYILTMIT